MASLSDRRTVERQRFFPGQRLLPADLDEVVAHHRWRRELHNRSLHQAGFGNGFPVTAEPGDREVVVGPGYALDAQGHEIIATRERREPVPPVAGDPDGGPAHYDLVVAYPPDDSLEESETRAGVCGDRGTVRLLEEPVYCWVRLAAAAGGELHPVDPAHAAAIDAGLALRLARIEVRDCRLEKLSTAERRNARPPAQPYVRCGHEAPAWTVEPISLDDDSLGEIGPSDRVPPLFFVADVDTSAAGFRTTPFYSAGLRGPRTVELVLGSGSDVQRLDVFADGVPTVEDPTPEGFRLRVRPILLLSSDVAAELDPETLRVRWTVAWTGVEP